MNKTCRCPRFCSICKDRLLIGSREDICTPLQNNTVAIIACFYLTSFFFRNPLARRANLRPGFLHCPLPGVRIGRDGQEAEQDRLDDDSPASLRHLPALRPRGGLIHGGDGVHRSWAADGTLLYSPWVSVSDVF